MKIKICTVEILASRRTSLVTGAVFPSVLPPLIHAGAVELRLAQPDIDVVVDTTEPLRKSMATPGVRLIGF